MERIIFIVALLLMAVTVSVPAQDYYGRLTTNPYAQDSISNPYNEYGSPYSAKSLNNPYGAGNPYSPKTLGIYDSQGNFHGNINTNAFDPDSIHNPYGKYGSPYSTESIKNPYGAGNPYSMDSPSNPYGQGMIIIGE